MACTVGIGNTPTMTTVPPPILYHRWVGWHAPAMRRAAGVALIGLVVALVLLRFVTVMLPAVPAWAPDRVGVGRASGSDRNRPSDGKQAGCSPGAGAWRLVLAARVAPS